MTKLSQLYNKAARLGAEDFKHVIGATKPTFAN